MGKNIKELNKQQLDKIKEGIQQAKYEGRKVIGYLAGGDQYYYMSLKSLRKRSLFLAIMWGCFSVIFGICYFYILSSINTLMNIAANSSRDIPNSMYVGTTIGELVLVVIVASLIIAFVFSVQAYRLRLNPVILKVYGIYSTVVSILLAILSFRVTFSENGVNGFGLFFGCLLAVAAYQSAVLLTDIANYRDWFINFGKKKTVSRSKKKDKDHPGKINDIKADNRSIASNEDDGYYDNGL